MWVSVYLCECARICHVFCLPTHQHIIIINSFLSASHNINTCASIFIHLNVLLFAGAILFFFLLSFFLSFVRTFVWRSHTIFQFNFYWRCAIFYYFFFHSVCFLCYVSKYININTYTYMCEYMSIYIYMFQRARICVSVLIDKVSIHKQIIIN